MKHQQYSTTCECVCVWISKLNQPFFFRYNKYANIQNFKWKISTKTLHNFVSCLYVICYTLMLHSLDLTEDFTSLNFRWNWIPKNIGQIGFRGFFHTKGAFNSVYSLPICSRQLWFTTKLNSKMGLQSMKMTKLAIFANYLSSSFGLCIVRTICSHELSLLLLHSILVEIFSMKVEMMWDMNIEQIMD